MTADRFPMSFLGRLPLWWWVAGFAVALAAATPFDRALYFALRVPGIEISDTYQLFRAFGHAPTWLLFVAALLLLEPKHTTARPDPKGRPRSDRNSAAVVFIVAPALAGILAELVKLLLGRMRPEVGDGWYTFKPLFGAFTDGSNLGFASSHAAVAMGGAMIVAYRFPRLAWVLVPAAIGCGITRLLGAAHYVTDVIAGWGIGALVAYWLRDSAILPRDRFERWRG